MTRSLYHIFRVIDLRKQNLHKLKIVLRLVHFFCLVTPLIKATSTHFWYSACSLRFSPRRHLYFNILYILYFCNILLTVCLLLTCVKSQTIQLISCHVNLHLFHLVVYLCIGIWKWRPHDLCSMYSLFGIAYPFSYKGSHSEYIIKLKYTYHKYHLPDWCPFLKHNLFGC